MTIDQFGRGNCAEKSRQLRGKLAASVQQICSNFAVTSQQRRGKQVVKCAEILATNAWQ
jgi:hypothetical protein